MSVRERGNGYQMSVVLSGQRFRKQFPTKLEAMEAEARLRVAHQKGEVLPSFGKARAGEGMWSLRDTYNKVWSIYWRDTDYPQWQIRHQNKVEGFFGPDTLINHITSEQITEFVVSLREQGLQPSTINHSIQSLRKVLRFADQNGKLTKYPFIQTLTVNNKRTRYLTEDECKLIIRESKGLLRDAIIVALLTGVRASEMLNIRPNHVENSVLYIPVSKNHMPRSIPLAPMALEVLLRRGTIGESYIREWGALRERLGLHDVVWHTLRHTFASHLIQKGNDVSVVMELMGHKRIETTLRYAKLAPKNFKSAINTLGNFNPLDYPSA